jgi:hypothetical protein
MNTAMRRLILMGAVALGSGLNVACCQAAFMAGDDVAVFTPPNFDSAGIQPSLIFEQELSDKGGVSLSWPVRPRFSTAGGKAVAKIKFKGDVDLYGNGEVSGPLRRNDTDVTLWNTDNYCYQKAEGKRLYQSHPWVIGVRPDGSASGTLYDDAGNGFGYQTGDYAIHRFVCSPDGEDRLRIEIAQVEGNRKIKRSYRIGYVTDDDVVYSEWSGNRVRYVSVIPDETMEITLAN